MRQTWRWFGPRDLVSIDDMLQAGVQGVVSALHHVPTGDVWTPGEIAKRQAEIGRMKDGAPSGIAWEVVESLPVSESIKKQAGDWRAHVANWITSMRNLRAAGIEVICYNFMPVLDWTRTDLAHRRPTGATCMRFDLVDFAAFDIHVLARPGAAEDFPEGVREAAAARFATMDDATQAQLANNVAFGLPGAADNMTLADVRAHLAEYAHMSEDALRANLVAFLEEVTPEAEKIGMRLCCHPDDPPFPLLGLPRIMSTEAQYRQVLDAVDSPANGVTLCSGSLGARPDNDLPGMMRRLGDRVHFLHLRNVTRESDDIRGSFHEAEHLGGDTDMVALIHAVLEEEARRRAEGRADWNIPMRPDHGQDILDDLTRKAQPGYPAIGRLRGLAELRGVEAGLSRLMGGAEAAQ
ncbi:mannonate dehydratase [Rhodovulum sp. DZ06]|uniref:mannonate dehydratase n=1 Tax=Rhodovulum sp. DZ06 TaxID=3425126 RepID=UPI003D335AE1